MRTPFLVLLLAVSASAFAGTGKIVIINSDAAGVGFNDPAPRAPIGGNPGTTLGQQRLNVFLRAAERWSSMLDTNVDIRVQASFASIPGCTAEAAILGQAAPWRWRHSFPNAPQVDVWYPIALANKFAGQDLQPSEPDIQTRFNADVDNSVCLGTSNWYYGFDGQTASHSDLYIVVLHEIAHGLGFAGATAAPGFRENRPSVFDQNTYDAGAGLRWTQMNEAQREVSMTNTGKLSWSGPRVRAALSQYLDHLTTLTLSTPPAIARNYDVGFASFGPDATTTPMSGNVIRVTDAVNDDGLSPNDGCTAFTNAGAVAGNIAFVDRGTCTYVIKARNAQAAGATGIIIGDRFESYTAENPPTCLPPGMSGVAPDVTIPIVSVNIADASSFRTEFGNSASFSALLRRDPSLFAGATPDGHMRLYGPCTNDPGSSLHHWDTVATPNLLMEPAINDDLADGVDLTIYLLQDIGWTQPAKSGRGIGRRK